MVVFGVPKAVENAPRKAIDAALGIRDAIANFSVRSGIPHEIGPHIGINTGPMLAGNIGSDDRQQFTVMGNTVNVASRREALSGNGQIYVGNTTYRHTKNSFQFRELKPISLRGRKRRTVPMKFSD